MPDLAPFQFGTKDASAAMAADAEADPELRAMIAAQRAALEDSSPAYLKSPPKKSQVPRAAARPSGPSIGVRANPSQHLKNRARHRVAASDAGQDF